MDALRGWALATVLAIGVMALYGLSRAVAYRMYYGATRPR